MEFLHTLSRQTVRRITFTGVKGLISVMVISNTNSKWTPSSISLCSLFCWKRLLTLHAKTYVNKHSGQTWFLPISLLLWSNFYPFKHQQRSSNGLGIHPVTLSLTCFQLFSGTAPLTPVELSTLSPTAAATSSFMKSGMTLTQVDT